MRRFAWGLSMLFILLIWFPLAGTFFGWDFYPSQNENRPIVGAPDFKTLPLEQWPEQTAAWFKDHFGFRNTFIRRYNGITRDWFKRQPDCVVMSDTGWLFTTSDGAMADFMGVRVLSEEEKIHQQEALEGRQLWLKTQGIGYLWVVAPNKSVIYPEEVPPELQASRGTDGIEQFMTFLDDQRSGLNRLDMRHVLLKNKDKGILYFSNDTHWTPLGSHFGYQSVIQAVQTQLPEVKDPVPLELCIREQSRWTGDLIAFVGDGKNRDIDYLKIDPPEEMSAKLEIVPDDQLPAVPDGAADMRIVNNPNGHGTAVVFHDSFGLQGWRMFLPLHFKETVFMVAARPEIHLFEYVIEKFNPDLIIEEQVHRMILHKKQPQSQVWSRAFKESQKRN